MIFPKNIAEGQAFYNRKDERKILLGNFKNIQHTLVISPRRYGKTSLILKAIHEAKIPFAHVDLFLAVSDTLVVERFLDGIARLIKMILPINIKVIQKIRDFFKSFNISVVTGRVSVELKFEPSLKSVSQILRQGIEGLEALLIKHRKTAVFFIDEIQDIVDTEISDEFEAILRFYAQKTKCLAFVFSGSNRKLLKKLFDDRTRPLYKMCDRINLQKIKSNDHKDFIAQAAKKHWKQNLTNQALEEIIELTEAHPFYVNYLCSRLWNLDKIPNENDVKGTWNKICQDEVSQVANELSSLTHNQVRLLRYIATSQYSKSLFTKESFQKLNITNRGLQKSLQGLLDRDLIEFSDGEYKIIDPLIKTILSI